MALDQGIFITALGLCLGSFATVLVHRLPLGQSIIKPSSHCPHCKTKLKLHHNLPLVGYLITQGRCAHCKARIPSRYPLIELLTAALALAAYSRFGLDWVLLVRDLPLITALVAITFIDIDHRIIPNELSIGGLVLALATAPFAQGLGLQSALIGAGAGFGFFWAMGTAYEKFTGRVGLGGGDVKLLAMFGAWLGLQGVFVSVLVSSVVGSVAGIASALYNRETSVMKTAIPYGPFLVIGALVHYFFGDWIWHQFLSPM